MTILIFTPYGSMTFESGLIYLIANYCQRSVAKVVQLQCDGSFPLCDRDEEFEWVRKAASCGTCIADQRRLAGWSASDTVTISSYLGPDDMIRTERWSLAIAGDNEREHYFEGENISCLVERSLRKRLPPRTGDEFTKQRLLLSSVRALIAFRRCLESLRPTFCMIAGGADFLSATFAAQCKNLAIRAAVARWNSQVRMVEVLLTQNSEVLECDLTLAPSALLRSDPDTWPVELKERVGNLILQMEMNNSQLVLPIKSSI